MATEKTKTCTRCKDTKPTDEFYKKKSGRLGVEAWCKKCRILDRMDRYEKNKEGERRYNRAYYQENKDQMDKKRRAWAASNRGLEVSKTLRYRARKRGATIDELPTDILATLKSMYGDECMHPECSIGDLEIDHIVPLSRGGSNTMDNFQLLCRSHNAQKHTKTIDYRPGTPCYP